jgi:hypothetical protein
VLYENKFSVVFSCVGLGPGKSAREYGENELPLLAGCFAIVSFDEPPHYMVMPCCIVTMAKLILVLLTAKLFLHSTPTSYTSYTKDVALVQIENTFLASVGRSKDSLTAVCSLR